VAKVSVEQALAKAKSHIKKGETAEAQALYANILQAFPNNKKAQQGFASLGGGQRSAAEQDPLQAVIDQLMSLYKQGQLEAVVAQAQDFTVQFPKAIALWNMLGASAAQIGKLDQAVKAFEQIISLNPNQANAHFNMGNALKDQGKLEEAIEAYSNALTIKPDYEAALNNVVVALKTKGKTGEKRLKKVLEAYNKAQALKNETANSYFRRAFDLQIKGKLEESLAAYSKVLAIKPDYADAYLNMGTTYAGQGKLEEALAAYSKVLAIKPDYADAYLNMGTTFAEQGKLEEAIHAYSKALAIKPDYADAYLNMGAALTNQGKLEEAIEAYNNTLAIKPDYADAYNNMGVALKDQGKLDEAVAAYSKALAHKPDYVEAYSNIGNALVEQGKLEKAVAAFNKALAHKPDYADAYNNMGIALKDQGKLEEAIDAYNKALAHKPDYADAYNNMGIALKDQGKLEEAVAAYNKALAHKPDYADGYNNLGNALRNQGKPEEAIKSYNQALAIKPDYAEAYSNMGVALVEQGKLEKAMEAYNQSVAIKPDYADAHLNMSFACLAVKDFTKGFEKYEWRWKTKKLNGRCFPTTKPMWNGEKKQRVLVWKEQGIGDEIMFSSIIPELYAASSQILVKCDNRLIPLFERSFSNDITYYSQDAHVPEDEYDFHIPMGSLPLNFRKSLDSFKSSASGFLKCDITRAESIKGQLAHEPGKKLVGISWTTKSSIQNSSTRNINLADLVRALDDTKTQLVCLQYGDVSDEIEAVKRDFGIDVIQVDDVDNMYDIDGLASLILACDQIVSTVNLTVHLAGALGAKVTALLPFASEWIWGDGSESFFYESVIPIKQKYQHNWNNVLEYLHSNRYDLK
jgi:tetratricopeptide (TPR) repeat protein